MSQRPIVLRVYVEKGNLGQSKFAMESLKHAMRWDEETGAASNIGRMNHDAVEVILAGLGIPVVARDVGGETGRRLTLDTASGIVSIRIPGGADYQI